MKFRHQSLEASRTNLHIKVPEIVQFHTDSYLFALVGMVGHFHDDVERLCLFKPGRNLGDAKTSYNTD